MLETVAFWLPPAGGVLAAVGAILRGYAWRKSEPTFRPARHNALSAALILFGAALVAVGYAYLFGRLP